MREREIADTSNPQLGFAFHPRCRYAVDACRAVVPEMTEVLLGRFVACHRACELTLGGVRVVEHVVD